MITLLNEQQLEAAIQEWTDLKSNWYDASFEFSWGLCLYTEDLTQEGEYAVSNYICQWIARGTYIATPLRHESCHDGAMRSIDTRINLLSHILQDTKQGKVTPFKA